MSNEGTLDWGQLKFDYNKTCGFAVATHDGRKWSPLEVIKGESFVGEYSLLVAAGCLHYATESFEGLRCFTDRQGCRLIFRPWENAQRFRWSCRLMSLPELPEEMFMEGLKMAADVSRALQPPYGSGASLYLRPFIIASGAQLGVRRSNQHLVGFYASAVGPYFGNTQEPIAFYLTLRDRVPAAGSGRAKAGANYGPSIPVQEQAKRMGCQAPLFTRPPHHRIITETHAANVALVINGVVVTPRQNSLILDSVTRRSVVQICRDTKQAVEEREITVDELVKVEEAMVLGTGATVGAASRFRSIIKFVSDLGSVMPLPNLPRVELAQYTELMMMLLGGEIDIKESIVNQLGWLETKITNPKHPGPITSKLYQHLSGIQQGDREDVHNWNYCLD